ncbi:MAG: hypothetical protein AAB971_01380 [Patescibacteria group bacterium]
MSIVQQQAVQELGQAREVRAVHLTPSGSELCDSDPAIWEIFLDAASQLTSSDPPKAGTFEWVGGGRFGHVYGLPDSDDMCLKVVTPQTIRSKSYNPHIRLPNLVTEADFMDLVGERLNTRSDGQIRAPAQYGVARFAGGSALLQQRIPDNFITIKSLMNETRDAPDIAVLRAKAETILARTRRALGNSILLIGLGDTRGVGKVVNAGNFFVERDKSTKDSDVYVIDLVGYSRRSQTRAATAVRLARHH